MKEREHKWKTYLLQACCWLLMVQLLNISIDPPATGLSLHSASNFEKENNFNQIESICELVAEEILDTGVPDNEDTDLEKTINPEVLYCSTPLSQTFELTQPALQHQPYYSSRFSCQYTEPPSQPPRNV